jgi:flagellin-like hook-associated protein FlgL
MRIGAYNSTLSLQLSQTTRAISRALERLSTGRRVTRVAEDPVSYSLGQSLRTKITGLQIGIRSLNDSKSKMSVIESSLQAQMDIAQKMREIAVQGANETLSQETREELRQEVQALMIEFQKITTESDFNGESILNGPARNMNASRVFYQKTGTGRFDFDKHLNTDAETRMLNVADINNDGYEDIVGMGAGNYLASFLSRGDGSFSPMITSASNGVYSLELDDIDGDGNLDAITESDVGIVEISYGRGNGSFEAPQSLGSLGGHDDMIVGDINADGLSDIIASSAGTLHVFTNTGNRSFTQTSIAPPAGGSVIGLALADFNGDGHMDVMGSDASLNLQLYLGDGSGNLSTPVTKAGLGGLVDDPKNSIAKDLDGDGDVDLILPNNANNTISVLKNDGSANFTVTTLATAAVGFRYLQLADLNGDDADDIIASTDVGFSVYLGNGAGSFASEITQDLGGSLAMGFALGDFNNDGSMDLAGALRSEQQIGIYRGRNQKVSGLNDIDFRNSEEAREFLQIVDNAIAEIEAQLSEVGLIDSQLNLQQARSLSMTEVLEEARSKIEDVDLALETAELVRLQILQQAQVAAATQANLSRRVVLDLLRF